MLGETPETLPLQRPLRWPSAQSQGPSFPSVLVFLVLLCILFPISFAHFACTLTASPPRSLVLEGDKGGAEETGLVLLILPRQPPAAGDNHHLLPSDSSGGFGLKKPKIPIQHRQAGFSSACQVAKFEHSFRERVRCVFLTESRLLPSFKCSASKH